MKKKSKTLSQMGEFAWIEKIRSLTRYGSNVLQGIGDDTAVLKHSTDKEILFTTDMIIEDQHFRRSQASPYEIGWKALAVNVSDIAAMGGKPTHAVVSAALPGNLSQAYCREIYRGIQTLAARFGINIVGGDTNAHDKIVLSVTLLGEVDRGKAVLRSGAKPGDVIFVTGELGGSYSSRKHLSFVPRLNEAAYLTKNFKLTSMMDISDGLAGDIGHIAIESRVGAVILKEAVPRSQGVSFEEALTDGEDFELLFTLSPREAARLTIDEDGRRVVTYRPIGKVVHHSHGIRLQDHDGKRLPLMAKGFDHFV